MIYFFDTNIILLYLRESLIVEFIEEKFKPFDTFSEAIVSVVTVAELKSIALQNKWGNPRHQKMEDFLSRCVIADIRTEDIINRYAEIDAIQSRQTRWQSFKFYGTKYGQKRYLDCGNSFGFGRDSFNNR